MSCDSLSIPFRQALDYLERALPASDRITMGAQAAARVAEHALAVRDAMPWGASIPGDVFLAYVLFPRVNNENPEFYHGEIWRRLRPRLRGLDMEAAAMEVNRWCFEQATYRSTDGRTANALTVLRRGYGRCGEESVLLVSALRSCGIPARQLYAPLWSHCDDNHAWVEAWVDGRWRYMGACEPELSLDSGWFTAAASKAMLVHTRAWGVLPKGERAEVRRGAAWVINRTAAYARTALLKLRILEGGRPEPGVRVDFLLANMACFGPICSKRTDGEGRAELLCGLGTLRVRLSDGARAMEAELDAAAGSEYELDFGRARPFGPGAGDFSQRPPAETRIQPADYPQEQVMAHRRWLAEAEAARQRAFAAPAGTDPLLAAARGNRPAIEAFLADGRFDPLDARALLESLREKDLGDVTAEVLVDALEGALSWKERYPREVWVSGVLCPRVADEMLYPCRGRLRRAAGPFRDAGEIRRFLAERVSDVDGEPEGLVPDPAAALERGICPPDARDILFVALCRANGIAARLDPLTGERQVWRDGAYRSPEPAARARLILTNGSGRRLTGGVHFSVSALAGDGFHPLGLYGREMDGAMELCLPAGNYRVMTATRQIDGCLEGRIWDVALAPGEAREVALTLREDRCADRLLRAHLPALRAADGGGNTVALPGALGGRPAIAAFIAPGQEPTEHFLNELMECREELERRGIAVCLLVDGRRGAENETLRRALSAIDGARCLYAPEPAALLAWRKALNAGELRLPLAIALDERGEGLFAFVNYNVGSVAALLRVIDAR